MFIVISIIFHKPEYSLAYLLGLLASNLNFSINYHFLNISNEQKIKFLGNPSINFIFRLLVYTLVLTIVLKNLSQYAVLFTLLGCLNIRIAIVVQQAYKGGDDNELYQ